MWLVKNTTPEKIYLCMFAIKNDYDKKKKQLQKKKTNLWNTCVERGELFMWLDERSEVFLILKYEGSCSDGPQVFLQTEMIHGYPTMALGLLPWRGSFKFPASDYACTM